MERWLHRGGCVRDAAWLIAWGMSMAILPRTKFAESAGTQAAPCVQTSDPRPRGIDARRCAGQGWLAHRRDAAATGQELVCFGTGIDQPVPATPSRLVHLPRHRAYRQPHGSAARCIRYHPGRRPPDRALPSWQHAQGAWRDAAGDDSAQWCGVAGRFPATARGHAGLDRELEPSATEVLDSFQDLLARIHHERTVTRYRLAQRRARDQDKSRRCVVRAQV